MDKRYLVVISLVFLFVADAGCREGIAKPPATTDKTSTTQRTSTVDKELASKGKAFIPGARDVSPVAQKKRAIPAVGEKIVRSDEEWKKTLSPEQYRVLRQSGTERAWSGPLNAVKQKDGVFHCAACNAPLFKADTKFESGSGWPSFYDTIKGRVLLKEDHSFGMERTEVVCAVCGGHLGHVFHDGPQPTGLRYCINSAAMNYEAGDSK